jgi:acyl-CoA synthetase (AMP-forming)/AMP-acid ligase II
MQPAGRSSLWSVVHSAGGARERHVWGVDASVNLLDLATATSLAGGVEQLRGRSALIRTRDQLAAALALLELDGVARRLVLCPYDLPEEHLPFVAEAAEVDAVVADGEPPSAGAFAKMPLISCTPQLTPLRADRHAGPRTEWVLLTSGTTGAPKLLVHDLDTFAGAVTGFSASATSQVWSTFYDVRRYGGLILLVRALSSGGSLVLTSAAEPVAAFLGRVAAHGVAHLTGSPSTWRRALLSPAIAQISPRHIRLSGEVVDQSILDSLRAAFPQAQITHAFAATETGLAFEVADGQAGFSASIIGDRGGLIELKIQDGSLRVRSPRTAVRYLGPQSLKDADGFVDTGDMVELRGERYFFAGRRDGVINVGGLKVYPEEIEAVLNQHPQVRMAMARKQQSSITGALVVAEVMLREDPAAPSGREAQARLKEELLQLCRSALARHKVPATISVVPAIAVTPNGKLQRRP